MKYVTLVVAAAAAALPASAMAQSFDGPYVGVQAGWNQDKVDIPTATTVEAEKRDAFVGGIYAGYDSQIAENIVLGVEGGFQITADDDVVGPNSLYSVDQRYAFDVSARAGYVIGEDTLAYVRGGYANSRVRVTDLSAASAGYDSDNLDGWFVGGGVERKVLDNVSARVEYRYYQYDFGTDDIERHQVLAGVAYRF